MNVMVRTYLELGKMHIRVNKVNFVTPVVTCYLL